MNEMKDYYAILGLNRHANLEGIKLAYRRLAKRYHPDVSKEPNAKAKFQEISEAYAILSNADKRSKYDLSTQLPTVQQSCYSAQQQYNDHYNDYAKKVQQYWSSIAAVLLRQQQQQASQQRWHTAQWETDSASFIFRQSSPEPKYYCTKCHVLLYEAYIELEGIKYCDKCYEDQKKSPIQTSKYCIYSIFKWIQTNLFDWMCR